MTSPSESHAAKVRCRALTMNGKRCSRYALPDSEPEMCAAHIALRAKHGAWPKVPRWAT